MPDDTARPSAEPQSAPYPGRDASLFSIVSWACKTYEESYCRPPHWWLISTQHVLSNPAIKMANWLVLALWGFGEADKSRILTHQQMMEGCLDSRGRPVPGTFVVKETVRRALKELEAKGFLVVERKHDGRVPRFSYRLVSDPMEVLERHAEHLAKGSQGSKTATPQNGSASPRNQDKRSTGSDDLSVREDLREDTHTVRSAEATESDEGCLDSSIPGNKADLPIRLFSLEEHVEQSPEQAEAARINQKAEVLRVTFVEGLEERRLLTRTPAHSKWRKALAALIEKFGFEEVESVMIYYLEHIDGEYAPVAYSGDTFRDKYANIRAWMDRRRRETKAEAGNHHLDMAERILARQAARAKENAS